MQIRSIQDIQISNPALADLIAEAVRVRQKAYAKAYAGRRTKVGAVITAARHPNVPSDTRLWFSGCNVENVVLLATHAEQAAIADMVKALGGDPKPVIDSVVVALAAQGKKHALPCGFCCQLIAEFGTPQTRIFGVRLTADGQIRDVEETTLGAELTHAFST